MVSNKYRREFDELPDELADWGMKAISGISSPKGQQQAARLIRDRIEAIWEEASDQMILDRAGQVAMILDRLGDPSRWPEASSPITKEKEIS